MKRIVCIFLIFALLFGMVACQETPSSNVGTDDTGKGGTPDSAVVGQDISVMSYNVQTGGSASVAERAPKMVETVFAHNPDLVGAQEVNVFWLEELEKLGFFEIYGMVGEPRLGDGQPTASNEYSCIFYKKDVFSVIDDGTYWLSDTPDEISKHPSADYYRIMTYAFLEHIETGMHLLHVNTHLEWNHSDNPTNTQQTEILLELTQSVRETYDYPATVYTGDFNEEPDSDGHALMLAWDVEDTRQTAEKTTGLCTFYDGYRGEWTDPESEGTILDYCFVTKGDFVAKRFDVDIFAEASDHFPVIAELVLL
ncbi:MAG: endonuclease/exonuclease/phosphatase family protein, partial [Clostridia bacterium]|nr:endonuclease/exonuclease/phosphatase family protein [Clostridia bacterium]